MGKKYFLINESKLNSDLTNRVKLAEYGESKQFQGKEIDFEFILQKPLNRGGGTIISTLIFDDCIFNKNVDIGDYECAGPVSFVNCIFNKSLSINVDNTNYDDNCQFNNDLTLSGKKDVLNISNLKVNGNLNIVGQFKKLIIKNVNKNSELIDQSLTISEKLKSLSIDGIFVKNFSLRNGIFETEINIINSTLSLFSLDDITLNTTLKINNCNFSKIDFKRIKGDIKNIDISKSFVEKLKLNIGLFDKFNITDNCSFTDIELFDANNMNSILNIEKSQIQNLKFDNLYNKGIITLREIRIQQGGKVSFKSSNLGKTDFIYCNFSKAKLEFENSKITEAFFSETEFPQKVVVEDKINYNQAQLAFGQLANAFQKQGDSIRSLEFASREIESHYESITLFSNYFFRKINLWLNFISNNFGRDWVRGFIFSFALGLFFFCWLLISSNCYQLGIPTLDFDLIPAYLKFMNPLRFFELEHLFNNTSKQGVIKLSSGSYVADFAGRIFIAYGYYQTIQAFRRFGRGSK